MSLEYHNRFNHRMVNLIKKTKRKIQSLLTKKISRETKYRLEEIKIYLLGFFRTQKPTMKKVVIFAQGRTGSTLLEDLISSTEYFNKNGELLCNWPNEIFFPALYVKNKANLEQEKGFIFHVKIYHLSRDRKNPLDPGLFLRELYRNDWKIIYLRRENKVLHTLSGFVATARGDYHKFSEKKEDIKLTIDCDLFAAKVEERIKFSELEESALKSLEHLELTYEKDLESPESQAETINKVLKFLSLPPKKAETKHKKITTTPLEKLILNYPDFSECMRQKGWLHFIEKEDDDKARNSGQG